MPTMYDNSLRYTFKVQPTHLATAAVVQVNTLQQSIPTIYQDVPGTTYYSSYTRVQRYS